MNDSAVPGQATDDRQALLQFLEYQRGAVLAIVEGLDERDWYRSVVPSGWTVAGLVEHLGGAEYHWFQTVVAGVPFELPEGVAPYDPNAPFLSDTPVPEIVADYREQCRQSDAVMTNVSLDSAPKGRDGRPGRDPADIRWVVLHMIEETARHVGHLDIARELLDGKTRLGQR